ncbi:MAG: hypothetical protein Q4B17_06285 [Lautropia sp.]|nr:hypothetical protein [Lautropia sp.]
MGVSWATLMLPGLTAQAQSPTPTAHGPDRAATTLSAPTTPDVAARPWAPASAPMADGVAHVRPAAPVASAIAPAATASRPPSAPPPDAAEASVALLAAGCANCHGPQGHPVRGMTPLHELPPDYLRQRLIAFRDGKAADATIMPRLVASYDDAQLAALARWFGRPGRAEDARAPARRPARPTAPDDGGAP